MEINVLGSTAALATFLSVWCGHVAVRKIESTSRTIWLPTIIFAALGIFVEYLSMSMVYRPWSVAFGIFGITLLFDALELTRQENRIKKGHAPANPNNPRHVKILADYSTATTLDQLKRQSTTDEVNQPISNL